jgi:plastocyanin
MKPVVLRRKSLVDPGCERHSDAMRRLLIGLTALLIAAVAAVPALAGSGPLASAAGTKKVAVKDNFFGPKTVRIRKGSVVKWVWRGSNPHNVRGKGVRSRLKTSGSYSHRYRHRGTFVVYCSIHRDLGMKMKVKVS